jgi:HD-GYP domain-containing protein (c-di-GMP phosphodiesterase class II)
MAHPAALVVAIVRIGEELGLDADSRNKLHWAALLHDVGKLDVAAAILNKTEKLTADEWQLAG